MAPCRCPSWRNSPCECTALNESLHRPVLLDAVVEALAIRPDGVYVDATYGRGGHTAAILAHLGPDGRLIVLDQDPEAIAAARADLKAEARAALEHESFARLGVVAERQGVQGKVDGLLLDLGVSSPQLQDPARGFSFQHDGPLDMRMDTTRGETAAAWIARADADEIADVLYQLGEERHARRIARVLVAARAQEPITTTATLARLIARAQPARDRGKHPSTRSFQAIRLHVNQELEALRAVLASAYGVLAAHARLAVISFHSLEDRIVKRFIREQARLVPARFRAVGKKCRADEAEIAANPRARSAMLRVAERLP